MNPAAVADTHAAIWYLFSDLRLSVSAKNAFDEAGSLGRTVLVSAITLAEMVYLVVKNAAPAKKPTTGAMMVRRLICNVSTIRLLDH